MKSLLLTGLITSTEMTVIFIFHLFAETYYYLQLFNDFKIDDFKNCTFLILKWLSQSIQHQIDRMFKNVLYVIHFVR